MTERSVFPNLPIEESGAQSARVCIATYEILGPSENGGIGTAFFSLATTLVSAGHDVTILYLSGEPSDRSAIEHWITHFSSLGIRFVVLPAMPRTIDVPQCMLTARDAYAWLRKQEFDVIHFPELQGHGYYSVLAKHQGIDFSRTTLCIDTHSPISWIREQNREAPYSPDELEMDFMERQSVALADVVLSPSQYMLRWMQSRGWTLPAVCYVQQNIASPELRTFAGLKRRRGGMQGPVELVFFGKLEERKGIGLFCDALDLLGGRNLPQFSVTFLGKSAMVSGRDALGYIGARAEGWAFPYCTITDRGHEAALRFLSASAGRIAIIPSLEDNLPNTVAECLAGRIPFLASRAGGIPELIADSDVERVTFPPNASELADHLGRALTDGVAVARPAIDPDENRHRWIRWHTALAARHAHHENVKTNVRVAPAPPPVTVWLNYCGGPELLLQSVRSLRRQSWPDLEVIVADSSRAAEDVRSELDRLGGDFEPKCWQIVRTAESSLNSTGTLAAAHAHGQYVLFMDAADYADPDAVATFVNAATRSGAEILTCFLALFTGAQEPNSETCVGHYPFLGCAILAGVFRNYFGSSSIFIRRDAFSRLGPFRQGSRANSEDWEFLARAALLGCRLEVVPRPLVWHRFRDNSGLHVQMEYHDQVGAVTPYAEVMPIALRDLPKAALTMKLHYERQYGLAHEGFRDDELIAARGQQKFESVSTILSRLDDEELLPLIVKQLAERGHDKLGAVLSAWLDYSSSRANLPPSRYERIPRIAGQLVKGRYHRFAHGFGSALRDLRRPPGSR